MKVRTTWLNPVEKQAMLLCLKENNRACKSNFPFTNGLLLSGVMKQKKNVTS